MDSSLEVEDSVTVQGPEIASILQRRFSPHNTVLIADGETEDGQVNYRTVLFTLRDELAASREELSAVELKHIDLKAQVTELSVERETLQEELAGDYTFLRGNLEKRAAGRKISAQAGLQGPTAQKSSRLLRQVNVVVYKLSKPGLELPEDRLGAFGFDVDGTVAKLKDKAQRFAKVLRRLRRLKRKLQVSQLEKDEAVERHRNTFFAVTRTLEGFYRLAGKEELAARIRPSVVQRGRRAVEVEDSPEGESGTPDQNPEAPGGGASAAEPSPSAEASAPSAVTASPSPEVAAGGVSADGDQPTSPAGAESSDA
jgi:hypothetical protein